MVKDRKKAISQARIMTQSSQVTFFTMNQRLVTRAATKTEATTSVAVVTAKTAGPRSGTCASASRFGSDMISGATLSDGDYFLFWLMLMLCDAECMQSCRGSSAAPARAKWKLFVEASFGVASGSRPLPHAARRCWEALFYARG